MAHFYETKSRTHTVIQEIGLILELQTGCIIKGI